MGSRERGTVSGFLRENSTILSQVHYRGRREGASVELGVNGPKVGSCHLTGLRDTTRPSCISG